MKTLRTENANKARSRKADEFALTLLPALQHCLSLGRIKSREKIAELEKRGIYPVNDGKWYRMQIIRAEERLHRMKREQPELFNDALDNILEGDAG